MLCSSTNIVLFLNYVVDSIIFSKTVAVITIKQSIHEPNRYWTDYESSQQWRHSLRSTNIVFEFHMDHAYSGDSSVHEKYSCTFLEYFEIIQHQRLSFLQLKLFVKLINFFLRLFISISSYSLIYRKKIFIYFYTSTYFIASLIEDIKSLPIFFIFILFSMNYLKLAGFFS